MSVTHTQQDKKSVAIVDDHFAVREGYRNFFKKVPYIGQVSLYGNAMEMITAFRRKPFDLVLLDIELLNEDGLEVCRQIKQADHSVRVLMMSSYHSPEYIIRAEQYDADGYLFKDAQPADLKIAIDTILLKHSKYFPTEAKEIIFDYERKFRSAPNGPGQELTNREKQVIKLICEGKSNKEIGSLLNREETTVAKHRQNIMNKIGAHKSIEIISYAISKGLYVPKVR